MLANIRPLSRVQATYEESFIDHLDFPLIVSQVMESESR